MRGEAYYWNVGSFGGRRPTAFAPFFVRTLPDPLVDVGGQGTGFFAHLVLDPFGVPLVHHGHKSGDAVETAGESRIRIHLHQDFLDFIHGQTRLKTFMQRWSQLVHIAVGGKGRDGDDTLGRVPDMDGSGSKLL